MQAAQANKAGAASQNAQAQAALADAQKSIASSLPGAPKPDAQKNQQTAQNKTGETMGQAGQGHGLDNKGFTNPGGPGKEGVSQVVTGLKPKEREAVALLQKEKAPDEYRSVTQQYLKNLASGEAPGFSEQVQ
jgi:hypothetical protein